MVRDKSEDKELIRATYKLKYFDTMIAQAKESGDSHLKDLIKLHFIKKGDVKLARYLCMEFILRQYKIITDFRTDEIKAYDDENKYYQDIGTEKIKSFLTKELNLHNTKHTSQEILHLLRTKTYINDEEIQKQQPFNLLPLKNCILDINSDEKIPHHPNYLFDFQIPIDYNPDAKCPKINKFFNEVVKKEDVSLLYDMFGLCLYRINFLDIFFILTGTGSNGKSRVLTLLENFLGQGNHSSITLKQLTEDKFAVARTYKKLANIGADIGGHIIYDTAILKSACSRDRVSGQFKFGQIFDFVPSATQIFSANEPPIFGDDSFGMYRRIEVIHFPYTFGNEKDMEENPECRKADPNIIERITTPDELSGLLNKAICHLKNIIGTGQLSVVRSTMQLKKDYTKFSNNVQAFVEEYCEEAEYEPSKYYQVSKEHTKAQGFLLISELYKEYCVFCERQKLVKKTKDGMAKLLRKLDSWNLEFNKQDWIDNPDHKERSVRGIRFKKKPSDDTILNEEK